MIKINLNRWCLNKDLKQATPVQRQGRARSIWGTASRPAWLEQQTGVNTCRKRGLGYPGAGPHRTLEAVIRTLAFIPSKMEASEGSGQRDGMRSSVSGRTTPQHPSSFPTTLFKPAPTTTYVPDPHHILQLPITTQSPTSDRDKFPSSLGQVHPQLSWLHHLTSPYLCCLLHQLLTACSLLNLHEFTLKVRFLGHTKCSTATCGACLSSIITRRSTGQCWFLLLAHLPLYSHPLYFHLAVCMALLFRLNLHNVRKNFFSKLITHPISSDLTSLYYSIIYKLVDP